MKRFKLISLSAIITSMVFVLAACGGSGGSEKSRTVAIDGSSTVFPIMAAVSQEVKEKYPNMKAPVGVSGTGGGFEQFVKGQTDLSNASRPITEKEAKLAEKNGIEYIRLELAYDGLSVVVNQKNTWVKKLTVEQLKKMWSKEGGVKTWSDINPEWPDKKITFFSPGTDSGTFDYFMETILNGQAIRRQQVQFSEDDNTLVQGVAGSKYGIGYFGYAYYTENKERLKIVPIVNPKTGKPVKPTDKTIQTNKYFPLSRPLFTYVNKASLKKDEAVYDYVIFTLKHVGKLAEQVGYVSLPQKKYQKQIEEVKKIAGKK